MSAVPPAYFVAGLLIGGSGLIFLWTDRSSRASQVLSICLLAIGLRLFIWVLPGEVLTALAATTLESLAILAGIEWGRRIGLTATARGKVVASWLFRVAQLLVLVYWLLSLGYVLIWPERATTTVAGLVFEVRGPELAVFAPILGTGMLCALIAIVMLRFMRIDRAEMLRLRALLLAGPFLLAGLVVSQPLVPITLAIGLLFFLYGSMRYLIIQGERGQFMSQFLSPEVARMVRTQGINRVLQRQRRPLGVVVCDLRGFTAYACRRDSDEVVSLLERFYELVGQAAAKHGGTVKDHAGDGVLILVGAPLQVDDHARSAALLALEIMVKARSLLAGHEGIGLGIGVASGSTTVGAIQGAGRLEYVAVGNAVNLAARLCSRAEDGEILVDDRTRAALQPQDAAEQHERRPEMLKGFDEPVPVYALALR